MVRQRKKTFEYLPEQNLRRIVDDLDGFGVPGCSRADRLIMSRICGPSRVPRRYADDAFDVLKHGLDTPEATPCKYGGLLATRRCQGVVHDGTRNDSGACRVDRPQRTQSE